MYKLLLATNDPAVVEAFSAVKWEELGFKQPRVVSTAEEALSSLLARQPCGRGGNWAAEGAG